MFQDLRFGLKLLWKEKAFSLTALLTLALCTGANTAIFTVLNAVVFNPLPFPESNRLVTMFNVYPGVGVERGSNGGPDYLDRRQMTDVFESVALTGSSGYDIGLDGSPQRVTGQPVTPSFFTALRAQPALGRAFTEEETAIGKEKVVVLSHGLWKQLYAGDRNVLGRDLRMSGSSYQIVGVMPQDFEPLNREAKLWVPLALTDRQKSDDARHSNNWGMIARLKPGVSVAHAQRRIDQLNKLNLERFPKYRTILENARFGTRVFGLKDDVVRDVMGTLFLLQAAVLFVLLIGCVNVANLMLVRSNVRMKELSIRFSMGATRARLARQLLSESLVLSLLGGALGVAVAAGGVRLLLLIGASEMPRGTAIHIDPAVLAFSGLVAVLTGIGFGAVPVIHMFHRDLNAVFRQTERAGTGEKRAMWARSTLVVCQVSLAFILLIGAGLLTLSFSRLLRVEPGFNPDKVLTACYSLPRSRYADDARVNQFLEQFLGRVQALPGVKAAGATSYLPFSGSNNSSVITIAGRPLGPGELPPVPAWNRVSSGYFGAMGIPVLAGRTFQESDSNEAQKVCVIDQFLARKYWPGGDAVGHAIVRGLEAGKDNPPYTIIGVVGMVKTGDLAEQKPVGQIYFHYKQDSARTGWLAVRSETEDPALAATIRRELQRADPELPLYGVKTLLDRVSSSMVARRAAMVICLVFAGMALTLSAVGIYGVLAYTVTRRTREFGIRMALGAHVVDVLGMVTGQGVKLAGLGLGIGLIGSLAITRLMTSLLYSVRPGDPIVFAAVVATLATVVLVASLIPSIRALRIRPADALRYE